MPQGGDIDAALQAEKIIQLGDVGLHLRKCHCRRALKLVRQLVPVCDVYHIYDNSEDFLFHIFKKRGAILVLS